MITISIQENEAWDRYSILQVKKFFSNSIEEKHKIQLQIEELSEQINIGIGYDKAREIYQSKEYTDLYNVNFELFNLFEKCKLGGIDAKIPDEANYRRHLLKNKLQEKFFGNSNNEIKLGYKNE